MAWYGWVAAIVMVLSSGATLGAIDKPRDPLTPGMALSVAIVNGLIAWAIFALGT